MQLDVFQSILCKPLCFFCLQMDISDYVFSMVYSGSTRKRELVIGKLV